MPAANWYAPLTSWNLSIADTKQGHISRDCTAPNGGPMNTAGKTCYKCGQPGHISKDCTAATTDGATPAPAPAPTAAPPADVNGAAVAVATPTVA